MTGEKYREILKKAELADYGPVHGSIVVMPYGTQIWKSIIHLVDEMLIKTEHNEVCLPLLIPEKFILDEMNYLDGLSPKYYAVSKACKSDKIEPLAIRPTSETVACFLFSKWIESHRDLPIKMYQWGNIARWETNTQPFIKGTEIQWLEGHTVHATHDDAYKEIESIINIFAKALKEILCFPVSIGKEPESRKFVGSLSTVTFEAMTSEGRALQLAAVYDLGQIFTKQFQVCYRTSGNQLNTCWMTDWGLGFRLIGALVLVHGDNRGLRLPPLISPIQVIIIELKSRKSKQDEIHNNIITIVNSLKSNNVRVHIEQQNDDKYLSDIIQYWEMKGVPIIIPIGDKEIDKKRFNLHRRDKEIKCNSISCEISAISNTVTYLLKDISVNLFEEALEKKKLRIIESDAYTTLLSLLDKNWVEASWCGLEECEREIVKKNGQIIRYLEDDKFFIEKHPYCIVCKRKARIKAVFAKNY